MFSQICTHTGFLYSDWLIDHNMIISIKAQSKGLLILLNVQRFVTLQRPKLYHTSNLDS